MLVVHHVKNRCLAALAPRNAPKRHYSRLHRAGVVVFVVAQPIQDLSAVSITDKTVGIRLPRLWCGAGLVQPCGITQNGCLLHSPLLYMAGVSGWGIAEFSTPGENGAKAAVNFCQMLRVF
jgi:hypothetical protein